ncbi:MAG: hypothetical protein NVS9B14_08370 [Candidatus Acidiferrum sp.]
MAKAKETDDFEKLEETPVEEDEATLAAIDQGLRDVKARRTVSLERVRELLPEWISDSSSPKKR